MLNFDADVQQMVNGTTRFPSWPDFSSKGIERRAWNPLKTRPHVFERTRRASCFNSVFPAHLFSRHQTSERGERIVHQLPVCVTARLTHAMRPGALERVVSKMTRSVGAKMRLNDEHKFLELPQACFTLPASSAQATFIDAAKIDLQGRSTPRIHPVAKSESRGGH